MNKWKFAAILAAGAALAMSQASLAAQAAPGAVKMGLKLKQHAEGAEVSDMLADGTGAAMGLKVGDIILEVNDKPITPQVVQEQSEQTKVGDEVRFKVKREGAIFGLTGKALATPEGVQAPTQSPE